MNVTACPRCNQPGELVLYTPAARRRRYVGQVTHNGAMCQLKLNDILNMPHSHDSECIVDPETDLCLICGVMHGQPCTDCGQRAFHLDNCREMEVA